MLFCAAGDIHGALDRLYDDVSAFECSLSVRFDCILHVGDFGIWPDPERVDKATRMHDGAGDFPRWVSANREAPRKTIFIKGNHEDFTWLDARPTSEVHPGLHYLRNGTTFDLASDDGPIRIGGIGGCYAPTSYERPSASLQGYAKRHYTQDEIERLGRVGDIDIILTHDAPAGVTFPRHRQGDGWVSNARGLDLLLDLARPRVCFFGHHHTRVDAEVAGLPCIGLNKVARAGNLVAFEMAAARREWRVLGEWPR